jgi:hypothetical protein
MVELRNPGQYRGIEPTGPRVPAYVEGTIRNLPETMKASNVTIAVAVNGVIRSTTKTTAVAISSLRPQSRTASAAPHWGSATDGRANDIVHFLVRVAPESFVRGRNEVTVHAVVEDEQGRPVSLMNLTHE